jgi:hypothetical protein
VLGLEARFRRRAPLVEAEHDVVEEYAEEAARPGTFVRRPGD